MLETWVHGNDLMHRSHAVHKSWCLDSNSGSLAWRLWYNKKYICSLSLGISWMVGMSFVIHHEPSATLSKFMLLRWYRVESLHSLRMGLVTRKTKLLEGWNFHPTHQPLGRGMVAGGQAQYKLWNNKIWWVFQLVNILRHWKGDTPGRARALWTPPSRHLALCISSIRLFLSCILYNKPVNLRRVFPWVLLF